MSDPYDPSTLVKLEPSEAIRRRPEIYRPQGNNQRNALLREALCMALEEADAGKCTYIEVQASKLSAHIAYDDSGKLMKRQPSGRFLAEDVFTQLYACRAMKSNSHAGDQLCCAGVAVLNAFSETFIVQIEADGHTHRLAFAQGKQLSPIAITGESNRQGVTIDFTLEPAFVDDGDFDLATLADEIHQLDLNLSGVQINFASLS